MKILENIKRIRIIKAITQSQMAVRLNVSLATYGKMERGEISITLDRFEKISDIFNLKPEIIYTFNSLNIHY